MFIYFYASSKQIKYYIMAKPRKRYSGKINDKERSKRKLIEAVGEVIRTKGYTGLNSTNIANAAGMSRRAISMYFGDVENLIEIYINGKDYWLGLVEDTKVDLSKMNDNEIDTEKILNSLLVNQFEYFFNDKEMQNLLSWQANEFSDIMLKVSNNRERLSKIFFDKADKELEGSEVDIRPVAALLVAGIYYLILHANTMKSPFCELDINDPADFERVKNTISLILRLVYDQA